MTPRWRWSKNRGIEHEKEYLAQLRADGLRVTEIPGSDNLAKAGPNSPTKP